MEQNIELKPKGKKKIITIVIILIILIAAGYLVGTEINQWWKIRKEYIRMGYASDKFPFRMYTEKELVEMGRWPVESQELINTPTRTRPEQTYAIFRQAIIDGNLEKALECFIEEKRGEFREGLKGILSDEKLKTQMLTDLPEKLEDTYFYTDDATGRDTKNRDLDHTATSSYYYVLKNDPKREAHTISFVKNWDGDWKIERL